MAKTQKNTARKTSGGVSKSVGLATVSDRVPNSRSRSSRSPRTVPPTPSPIEIDEEEEEEKEEEQNSRQPADDVRMFFLHLSKNLSICQWCAMCSDGNALLVTCDRCGAANCKSCVPGLAEVSPEDLKTYTYCCVGCCGRKEVFLVRYIQPSR